MNYSRETREELKQHREELLKQTERLTKELQAIDIILHSCRDEAEQLTLNTPPVLSLVSAQDIRGMKQKPALRAIARMQGGIIRTSEAKEIMVAARIMKPTKNAYKMVYNLIKTMAEFQPTENRGEYRLSAVAQSVN